MEIFGGSEWVAGPKLLLFVHAETIPSKGYPGPGAGKRHSHSVEVLLYHDYEGSNETLISVSRDVQNDPGGECISAMQDIVYEDYNPAAEVVRDWDNPIADWDPCLNVTLGSEDVTAVITHSIGDVTETEVRELPVFP